MRLHVLLAATLLGTGVTQAQDDAEVSIFVNALVPQAQLLVLGEPVQAGREEFLYADDPIDFDWDGPEAAREATLFAPSLGATLTVSGLGFELDLDPDTSGLRISMLPGDTSGALDLLHDRESPQVVVMIDETRVSIGRGAIRLTRTADGTWQMVASQGRAEVTADGDSRQMDAASENALTLDGGPLQSPARNTLAVDQMLATQSTLTRAALLPDLVRVAESVAEGDIEPPTRGSRVAAGNVAPAIKVKEIVPRGGLVTRVDNRAVSGIVGGASQTTAEAFIGSGEAALAVVGARLQRTRVVGVSGIGGSALSVNRELTLPFTLAPLRR